MEGVGLTETYRVGSVADKSYKYMFVTANDIKTNKISLICKLQHNI